MKKRHTKPNFKKPLYVLIEIVISFIVIYFTVQKVREFQTLKSNAASGQATIFLTPESTNIPPDGVIKLFATTDNGLAFFHTEIAFDPTQIKLSQDIALVDTKLTRVISKTPMASANSTGKIVIALGLDPAYKNAAPSGTINLATLNFSPTTTASNLTASLSISNFQLVDKNAMPFTVTTKGSNLQINPPRTTPTPTATPPTNQGSKIVVYAAGTPSSGIYPTMQLVINNKIMATWKNVRANPSKRSFDSFPFQTTTSIKTGDVIYIKFINDQNNRSGDRNLLVDKIVIAGKTYETESQTIYSVGSWTTTTSCNGGYKRNELLSCNGYFKIKI